MSAILVHPSHFPEITSSKQLFAVQRLTTSLASKQQQRAIHKAARGGTRDVMTTIERIAAAATALLSALSAAPNGRHCLKGSATSGCFVYAEDPEVRFEKDRIVV